VAGDGGLKLWRSGGTGFLAESGAAEDRFRDLRFTGAALVVREDQTPRLRLFAYRGVGESRVVGVARKEIWALAEDPSGTSLYAGSSDGLLSVVDPKTGAVTAHPLHTQGLTALVAAKGALASSSDDKTITIWQTPAMSVLWRSKAHDYLINGLCLAEGEPPSLWSASSDGTVKRWAWPQLEEQESLETKVLLGRGFTLAALWASPAGDRVLAGTWNSALLDFTRGVDGRWAGRVIPVPSQCLYSAAALSAVGAVLFGGFGGQRPGVYLYDVRAGRLETLEDLGVPLYNAYVTAPPGGREACVAGVGSALHYTFERGPAGELRYSARAGLDTDLGPSVSAAWLAGPDLLATGDPSGRVHLTGLSTLRGEPRFRSALPAGK
jgi:WD40 repeat protein